MRFQSAGTIAAALMMLAAGAAAAQTTDGATGGHDAASSQARSPGMPRDPAAQNRQLDQIGNKLLKETPRAKPGTTPETGGGLVPPH
jgi:hypothetical protein